MISSIATAQAGLYVPVHKRTGSNGTEGWRARSRDASPSPTKSSFPSAFGGSTETVNSISESTPQLPIYSLEALLSLGHSPLVENMSTKIQQSIKERLPEILMNEENRQRVKQLEKRRRRTKAKRVPQPQASPLSTQTASVVNVPQPTPISEKIEEPKNVVQVTPLPSPPQLRRQPSRVNRTSRRKLMEEASWRRGVIRRTTSMHGIIAQAQ
ncbi:hypothetical protein VNI00_006564 [Paramarasmius palmivorus]|uniref:Uncharacterized protein n=1 Tax=Paramarasmius palmivorus TaxID=297713 RepID=A0AAW0D781_9AGAR